MAGKSGDKVKKGFIFYVFMLLLLLIAAFLVIVVIMLFKPQTTILGYKYFSYNDTSTLTTIQDTLKPTNEPITFGGAPKVVVNSTYGSVKLIYTEDEHDYVKFVNGAKGFARSGDFTNFEYSVTSTPEGINITVKEPQSFLFFSKNVNIELGLCKSSVDNILNTEFIISTKSGNVQIGEQNEDILSLNLANLSVNTESGDITLNEKPKQESAQAEDQEETEPEVPEVEDQHIPFTNLQLATASGTITGPQNKILHIFSEIKLSVLSNGTINFGDIEARNGLQLIVNDGKFNANKIYGRVRVTNLRNGDIDIKEINSYNNISGSFDTNDEKYVGNASIKIGNVDNISIPVGNQANIEVNSVKNSALIITGSGDITIHENAGQNTYLETNTGDIQAKFLTFENSDISRYLNSDQGNINIKFVDKVSHKNYIRTNGVVDIALPQDSKFMLDLRTLDDKAVEKLNSNIDIQFVDSDNYVYPFKKGFQEGDSDEYFQNNMILINSDGHVNVRVAAPETNEK